MVLAQTFDAERNNANQTVPIFLAHGTQDPVLALQLGEDTRQLLEATQYSVEWHTYEMPHSVCQEEITDIAEWLRRVL
jgi:phospholipase/carboxylesterase